jgi:exportin-1
MSMSIDELDATVRAFFEGRGEQQKQAQATLNQVGLHLIRLEDHY